MNLRFQPVPREAFYFFSINFIYLFIFGCVGSSLLCGLSLVGGNGGYSSLRCGGFSLQWLLLLRSTGSRGEGFSSCGTRTQLLWRMGLVAPRHVGYSRTRVRTCVPCIGRWILNHCATREAQRSFLKEEFPGWVFPYFQLTSFQWAIA